MNATLCLLDKQSSGGVLPLTEETLQELRKKQPAANKRGQPSCDARWGCTFCRSCSFCEHWVNDNQSCNEHQQHSWSFRIVSQLWRCWKRSVFVPSDHGKTTGYEEDVCCTTSTTSLEAFLSCRLIPLDKNPSVYVQSVLGRSFAKSLASRSFTRSNP